MPSAIGAPRPLRVPEIRAYFERIGFGSGMTPDEETLIQLHRAHLMAVPFENLDIHRPGVEIRLDHLALFAKVVGARRGGFCYELNGLFAWLLESLGFAVRQLSARVRCEGGGFGPAFDHLCLWVEIEGAPWLADVGFGRSFVEPLRLVEGEVQEQASGCYRLLEDGDDWAYEEASDGAWNREYLFDLTPRRLDDFREMCRHHSTSPESHFTRSRVCTAARPWGRVTLHDGRLITTRGGERTEREVADEVEWTRILEREFGVVG